jgi:hypothetical protein
VRCGERALPSLASYESNVLYALRFMVDTNMGGGQWLEIPAGAPFIVLVLCTILACFVSILFVMSRGEAVGRHNLFENTLLCFCCNVLQPLSAMPRSKTIPPKRGVRDVRAVAAAAKASGRRQRALRAGQGMLIMCNNTSLPEIRTMSCPRCCCCCREVESSNGP